MKLHRTQLGYRLTLGRLKIHCWVKPKDTCPTASPATLTTPSPRPADATSAPSKPDTTAPTTTL